MSLCALYLCEDWGCACACPEWELIESGGELDNGRFLAIFKPYIIYQLNEIAFMFSVMPLLEHSNRLTAAENGGIFMRLPVFTRTEWMSRRPLERKHISLQTNFCCASSLTLLLHNYSHIYTHTHVHSSPLIWYRVNIFFSHWHFFLHLFLQPVPCTRYKFNSHVCCTAQIIIFHRHTTLSCWNTVYLLCTAFTSSHQSLLWSTARRQPFLLRLFPSHFCSLYSDSIGFVHFARKAIFVQLLRVHQDGFPSRNGHRKTLNRTCDTYFSINPFSYVFHVQPCIKSCVHSISIDECDTYTIRKGNYYIFSSIFLHERRMEVRRAVDERTPGYVHSLWKANNE